MCVNAFLKLLHTPCPCPCRAVIVGWDIGCCETDAWLEATQTPEDKLNSIFYLVSLPSS